MMFQKFPFLSAGFVWLALPALLPAKPVSYSREVRPILSENCFYCHGPDGNKRKADLRLDTLHGQRGLAGKQEAKAVVPGQPEASEMVKRLLSKDPDEMMPPPNSNRHITAEQKELLKRWIAEGANFEEHWTFLPPVKAPVPQVAGFSIRNPIDAFVAEKLTALQLPFSPEADKVTLIRRLYFDLIGLPPKPEEVDAFIGDTSPDAYEKLVDRLMASPHYGERLVLPWLDAARYADSNGFQQDGDTHQYVWRDWVVQALNADMPFDQFSIEQLAGDLLSNPTEDQLVATGFNRNHLLNGEGGAIAEEQRHVILFDRVDTTATNWLGLTMACAQCHDHKYDPLTMTDYYSLMAMFNNVPESGVPSGGGQYRIADPWIPVGSIQDKAKLKELEAANAKAKEEEKKMAKAPEVLAEYERKEKELIAQKVVDWTLVKPLEAVAAGELKFAVLEDMSLYAEGKAPDKGDHTLTIAAPEAPLTGLRIETIPDRRLPRKGAGLGDSGNAVLTGMKLSAGGREYKFSAAAATYSQGGFSPQGAIDDDVKTAWAFFPETNKPYTLTVQTAEPVALPAGTPIVLKLEFQSTHKQHLLGRFRISLTSAPEPTTRMVLPDEISTLVRKPERTKEEMAQLRDYVSKNSPPAALAKAREAANSAEKQFNDFRGNLPRVMVMSDSKPRQTKILNRGEYLSPTTAVSPNSPAFLPPIPADLPKNRLGFARWLFLPNHPLTARVQVNRIWQYFFGIGLIKTAEDLGVQSEVPIHNALLDWLSVEFREKAWSQKQLVKLILTSTTYRQSSKVTPAHLQKDPENRYISRAARFRLPSMILRDLALSASGLLNLEMGGKPVYPYQPDAVWENLAITKERDFTYPASKGNDLYRRSLYTFWRRTIGPTNMFDASARQTCKVRSSLTSTPLHALTTMNDITWVEAARVLAENAMKATPDRKAQITWAYRKVLARPPGERDLATLHKAWEKQHQRFAADAIAATEFVSVGTAPRDAALPAADHAALAAVCLAIFNLDESLTRQ